MSFGAFRAARSLFLRGEGVVGGCGSDAKFQRTTTTEVTDKDLLTHGQALKVLAGAVEIVVASWSRHVGVAAAPHSFLIDFTCYE